MTNFALELERLLRQFYYRELVGLDYSDQLRPGGFTGIRMIFDEVPEFRFWTQRPKQFTPSEFNDMWDSFTADQKFNYILTLIT